MLELLAQATERAGGPPRVSEWSPRFLWPAVALVAALLIGAIIIALVDRWRKRPLQDRPSANDELAEFRSLYERGELSREEYDKIRSRLGERLRQDLDLPAPPATSSRPPAAATEPMPTAPTVVTEPPTPPANSEPPSAEPPPAPGS
jgi:hypothetical protein